jgi:hypothetical protein
MRRHLGMGSVDLRLVQTGLDQATLALLGTMRRGTPPMAASARGSDSTAKRLRPGRLDVGEVRGAQWVMRAAALVSSKSWHLLDRAQAVAESHSPGKVRRRD